MIQNGLRTSPHEPTLCYNPLALGYFDPATKRRQSSPFLATDVSASIPPTASHIVSKSIVNTEEGVSILISVRRISRLLVLGRLSR